MTVAVTWKIYAKLSGVWTDLTSDVIGAINVKRGISNATITDRIAGTGVMKFSLKNFTGDWLPDPGAGWEIGTLVKLVITYSATDYIRFYGPVDAFTINNNVTGYTTVDVTVVDWFDYAARALFVYTGVFSGTAAQSITELLSTLSGSIAAVTTDLEAGGPTMPAAFSAIDLKTTVMVELSRLTMNCLGYLYLNNDNTDGYKLVYETGTHRDPATDTPAATFDNNMISLDVRYGEHILNNVTISQYPTILYAGTELQYANTWTSTTSPVTLTNAVGSEFYLVASLSSTIGLGSPTNVSSLSYSCLFRHQSDDSAAPDSDVTKTYNYFKDHVTIHFVRAGGSDYVYLSLLQIYGTDSAYQLDTSTSPVTDATSIAAYGEKSAALDLKYVSDYTDQVAIASDWITRYKDPATFVTSIFYDATKTATLMSNFLACDIGAFIRIKETNMSIDTKGYIQQETIDILPKGPIFVRYDLLDT